MIKKGIAPIILAGFLAACAGLGGGQALTADQRMAALCAGTDDVLETLLPLYSTLSEAEKATVDAAGASIVPRCAQWKDGTLVPTLALVEQLNKSLQELLIMKGGLE